MELIELPAMRFSQKKSAQNSIELWMTMNVLFEMFASKKLQNSARNSAKIFFRKWPVLSFKIFVKKLRYKDAARASAKES